MGRAPSQAKKLAPKTSAKPEGSKADASAPGPKRPSVPGQALARGGAAGPSEQKKSATKPRDPPSKTKAKPAETKDEEMKRPTAPRRKASEAPEPKPKKEKQAPEDQPPRRPSTPSTETPDATSRRPSLGPKKSSQKLSKPGSKSMPSGRRVSFEGDEPTSLAASSTNSKLPDVKEEDVQSTENPPETTTKQPPSQKKVEVKSPNADAGDEKPKEKRKPPKLGKPKAKRQESQRATAGAKPRATQKPSDTKKAPAKLPSKPKKSEAAPSKTPDESGISTFDQKVVEKTAESDKDLKSFMSEDQCGDLTLLVADITLQMRRDIESRYDASKGLKLIKDDKNGSDVLEKDFDFDPGTVDVSKYDKERKIRDEQEKELAKPETKKLKEANLQWFDGWRQVVILRVGEAVNSKKTASEQKQDASPKSEPRKAQRIQKFDAGTKTDGSTGPKLEDLFPRIKTPLTKLPMNKRVLVLHSMLLLLLSLEHYNAASRVLLLYLTTSLKIGLNSLRDNEEKTAQGLLKAAKEMTADDEASKRLQESDTASRKWKVRLATAAGAAVIGYTGGLAAPMIAAGLGSVMGELGLGTTAAAGYLGTVASNAAVVGTLFGAYGGRMTGQVMENISAGVQDFGFLPIHGERKEHDDSVSAVTNTRRLRVVVAISGWLLEKEEVVTPWRVLKPSAEVFALRFELEALLNLGQSFDTMLQSAVYGYAQSSLVKQTVFSEVMSGMMWPMALTKVARVVDNPFSLAQTRADKAGQVLADALINHVQGERPVTLIGYSLGARVIWSCLTSLAKRKAFGLVESAVLMGSPLPSDTATWRSMRSAVSGRLVNVYSENDYLLAFLYRTSALQYGVAGLVPIMGLAGIENVDVTETVSGHLRYRYLVGSILQKIRFEDIDKDEVTKEAKAFEAIVEEEKKRTYVKQAGELYETYKGKKPTPKSKKQPKKKMDNVSDADAEKEASAMEKSVEEKTKTSLMQWAVEQLYLSSPSADKAKDKASKDAKGAAQSPSAKVEAGKKVDADGKSYYQRVKEATYLARSGGPEGEKVEQAKQEQAQEKPQKPNEKQQKPEDKAKNDTKPEEQSGYLSNAAGYIPTGYVPSLRGKKSPAKKDEKRDEKKGEEKKEEAKGEGKKPPKKDKAKEEKDEQKADDKKDEETDAKKAGQEDEEKAKPKSEDKPTEKESQTQDSSSDNKTEEKAELPNNKDTHPPESTTKEEPAQPQARGYTSYLPTFGYGRSSSSAKQNEQDKDKGKGKAKQNPSPPEDSTTQADHDHDPATSQEYETPQEDEGAHVGSGTEGEGASATQEKKGGTKSGFTTDTEGANDTDGEEDPFTTPPAKGEGNCFEERVRGAAGGK